MNVVMSGGGKPLGWGNCMLGPGWDTTSPHLYLPRANVQWALRNSKGGALNPIGSFGKISGGKESNVVPYIGKFLQ